MLNRRTLRIKAMQSLFAYKHCKAANFELAKQQIHDAFLPDLNSMEVQDKVLLKKQDKEASELFKKHYKDKNPNVFEGSTAKINQEVIDAIKLYYKNLEQDRHALKDEMLKGVLKLTGQYAWILQLTVVLAKLATSEKVKKGTPPYLNFIENKVIESIAKNNELATQLIKCTQNWEDYTEDLKSWLKNVIRKDEEFIAYLKLPDPTFEQDKELLLHVVKTLLFKSEMVNDFFELIDLRWSEDKAILKSLVTKTIKSIEESQEFKLMELSYNWEEDLDFFKTIYDTTISQQDAYEELIAAKSKNWELDRIASTDIIMLEMALQEMVNFPSIPIKVTINEYIEISKKYSTPKSKQFVNGVLDVIAVDLQKQGVIKKSGRGLIDNK